MRRSRWEDDDEWPWSKSWTASPSVRRARGGQRSQRQRVRARAFSGFLSSRNLVLFEAPNLYCLVLLFTARDGLCGKEKSPHHPPTSLPPPSHHGKPSARSVPFQRRRVPCALLRSARLRPARLLVLARRLTLASSPRRAASSPNTDRAAAVGQAFKRRRASAVKRACSRERRGRAPRPSPPHRPAPARLRAHARGPLSHSSRAARLTGANMSAASPTV